MIRITENISHFSCISCEKKWSVVDAPKEKTTWFCPWCGHWNREAKDVAAGSGSKTPNLT